MIKYVFLDLDGTITDSAPGILNSIEYAIEKMGFPKENRKDLEKYLGPPLTDAFSENYHISEEDAYKMVMFFREYFGTKGIIENDVFDGFENVLKNPDKTFVLATSKPEHFAKRILEHFDLYKYFKFISGSPVTESNVTKLEIIERALKELKITDLNEVIMVGDRKYDADGANDAGIKSIGVLYGYGSEEEIKSSGFTYIVNTVEELNTLIKSL